MTGHTGGSSAPGAPRGTAGPGAAAEGAGERGAVGGRAGGARLDHVVLAGA
ncbi:hypothetical protein [Streptomyces sulfonofaciens]|uniref:hypothetical protein n=1 Tax=Streptomyces sulfonofaciens TaxID=68272 RepID=UPI0027E3EA4C|nr:hypothetical protein [Streptomyces sulfonofaciens]